MDPTACSVAGALAALVALAPVVGDAPESDGDGTGLLGVGVGLLGVGVGDGDVDTGGLALAVGLGLGLQPGEADEDGAGEPACEDAEPLPDDDGEGTWLEVGLPFRLPLPWPPEPPLWMCCDGPIPL